MSIASAHLHHRDGHQYAPSAQPQGAAGLLRLRLPAILALGAAAASLAGCAPAKDMTNFVDDKAPPAVVSGKPVSCIPLVGIRESRVRSDYTIDFVTSGNDIYRNTLANRCSGLGFEQRFSYSTSLSQLCNTEIITILDSSGYPLGSCGLGDFVPVTLVDAPN
ncbi:hypothetical protein RM533_04655 [Croceicoccus sp. F390]|uniref:Lipoprotein n=1 Tax=Croceicoccus esteveae TaxID=3075597 RepID=A0ABU2ZFU1_9SPHN|nr:hypothetical protein [Croceicoccus sp. F390]MDT0575468.1 hypothetical protein [Croceicoccus sp. F390]